MALIFSQVLLSIAAVISLALGLFQDFGPSHDPDDPQVDWVEGVAIVVAIIIVVRSPLSFLPPIRSIFAVGYGWLP